MKRSKRREGKGGTGRAKKPTNNKRPSVGGSMREHLEKGLAKSGTIAKFAEWEKKKNHSREGRVITRSKQNGHKGGIAPSWCSKERPLRKKKSRAGGEGAAGRQKSHWKTRLLKRKGKSTELEGDMRLVRTSTRGKSNPRMFFPAKEKKTESSS